MEPENKKSRSFLDAAIARFKNLFVIENLVNEEMAIDKYWEEASEEEKAAFFAQADGIPVVFAKPRKYGDVMPICDSIRKGAIVILDVEGLPRAEAMRTIDFCSGGVAVTNGMIHHVTNNIFIFGNIDVSHLEFDQEEKDSDSPIEETPQENEDYGQEAETDEQDNATV